MDRVRAYENVRNIPEEIVGDKNRKEIYNKIIADCKDSSLTYGCSGRLCQYESLGGPKKGIIELVDGYLHTAVIYSLDDKIMIEKPIWDTVEYRGTMNRSKWHRWNRSK